MSQQHPLPSGTSGDSSSQRHQQYPSAPYPPFLQQNYPSTQASSLRSALSTSPHYAKGSTTTESLSGSETSAATSNNKEEASKVGKLKSPARVRFVRPDLLATINCELGPQVSIASSFDTEDLGAESVTATSVRENRRKGPILLSLQTIQLNHDRSLADTRLFRTRTVCISRGNPSLGTSLSSTCLDAIPTCSPNIPAILAGLTTGALCVHSFAKENFEHGLTSSIEYYHSPLNHHRAATSVSWRPNTNQAAIGLVWTSSAASSANSGNVNWPNRRPLTGGPQRTSADSDYCCFVWDVEHQASSKRTKSSPLYKLSHQTGVASLTWLFEEGHTLAVGGKLRNLQLFDLRAATAPVTVYAHNFGTHGLARDPHRPYQFASFCHAATEPVKLWDARRMESSWSEIKLPNSDSASVSAMEWSSKEPGVLAIALGDSVYEYDTSISRPVHTSTVRSSKEIQNFSLFPFTSQELSDMNVEDSLNHRMIAELYPRRMVVAHSDRTLGDLARHHIAPLAISRRDGRVVHALGRTLLTGSTDQGPSAMESLQISRDEDISATMMRRARCQHVARYSMDASVNIKMLSEDGIRAAGEPPRDGLSPVRDKLIRLWSWIERIESLCLETDEGWEDVTVVPWPARGLGDAGTYRLLSVDSAVDDSEEYSDALACNMYDSPGRRSALTSCGWVGKFDLINVLGECEEFGEYERSAALAVWHGELGAAVDALQRGADHVRAQLRRQQANPLMSPDYAETLELVSLSIAGYRGGDFQSPSAQLWRRACANIMTRNSITGPNSHWSRVGYIRGILNFLMTVGTENGLQGILKYESLSLCDRVAFACRFLPRKDLILFLDKCILDCQKNGNVEGIVVTGIEKEGIKILQSYVDKYGDVQTAALVTSRVIFPLHWIAERQVCTEWLESYRSLLNSWQMWQSRAMFDVDRAELLRKVKSRQFEGSLPNSQNVSRSQTYIAGRMVAGRRPAGKQPDRDIQASVPAQLDARCNYCSASLGLRQKESNANQWLSKMKPVLSCCPQCRKPLPRCAICMLSLGALNPYLELTKERARSSRGPSTTALDDYSSLANLPFAEWFTWCMRCKHGGHAHHLVGWFAKHEVCPVSGCDCRCQFDSIQKLNRPALSQANQTTLSIKAIEPE